ncbi:MAG TPA: winged helix DNA-binding domain-containing protein [Candidatus Saccharimonadales bacterium]
MNIAAKRLQSQRIAGPKFDTPAEVVRWMGAVQAQDYGQAVWAIGVRLKQPSLAAVQKAIIDRSIVATWPMRGTIHFVPAEDAKWMVETLSYKKASRLSWHQKLLGITDTVLAEVQQLVVHALQGGNILNRPQLMELFESNDFPTKEQRGYLYLSNLAEKGIICQGPLDGKQQTFVLLDEWVPQPINIERTAAITELATRYFTSHGPATVHDFANWTGLGVVEARQGLEGAKNSLSAELYDDVEYWLSKEVALHSKPPLGVHLLPGFDEFILGYKDRSAVLHADHARLIVPGNNGVFKPTIVFDGQVVGTWARTIKKKTVDISFTVFPEFSIPQAQLEAAATVYADFVGLPLTIVPPK